MASDPIGKRDSGPRVVALRDSAPDGRRSGASEYVEGYIVGQHYRLVRRLGEGGMGAVWVARNETLEVDVAIKFIRGDLDMAALDTRLLQEARAAARLGHPAIVRILEFGRTPSGDPYIVMELLDGETLSHLLERRGRLPALRAVRTLLPVAHALATAHEKGIVHRDLKPDNIFLVTHDGLTQPKLVDFGIAKLDRGGEMQRITQFGLVAGTPGYMSPEQARGEDVDHRADIWALCVVLYEAVTGRLPFEGKSYNALLRSIIEDVPPPITTFAAGDEELWAILAAGLTKDPEKRWGSMRALGAALAQWATHLGAKEDIAGASLQAAWLMARGDTSFALSSDPPPPNPGSGGLTLAQRREAPTEQLDTGDLPAPAPTPVAPELASTPAAPQLVSQEVPVPASSRKRWILGAILLGVAALVGVVVLATTGSSEPPAAAPIAEPPALALTPAAPVPERAPPVATPSAVAEPTPSAPPSASAEPPTKAQPREPAAPAKPPVKKLEIKTEL